MKIKSSIRIVVILVTLILGLSIISPLAMARTTGPTTFPLRTNDDPSLLVADENTRYITSITQNPDTKLITVTVQIQHNSPIGTESLAIQGLGIQVSYNGKVAPYAYKPANTGFDPELIFGTDLASGRKVSVSKQDEFKEYGKSLVQKMTSFGNTYITRTVSGGMMFARLSATSGDGAPYVTVSQGQTLDIAEFYFMPINGEDKLTSDMFNYEYFYDYENFIRISLFLGKDTFFLEASEERLVGAMNSYVISPSSFKIHVQRPTPDITGDNFDSIYNPDTMEWSYSADGPYTSSESGINRNQKIFVRAKDTNDGYSGNDPLFGAYKKYTGASAPIEVEFSGVEPTKYTVTFDGNSGSPAEQTRQVVENTSIGSGNMPPEPILSGFSFTGWNTAQNGMGTAFTATTVVTGPIRVYAQWTQIKYTVTFDGNSGTPAQQTREVNANSSVGADNMPTQPALSGFTFAGWNTEQDGSGTAFTATTAVTGHIRVFAQWTQIKYTVTFDGNDGMPAEQTREVNANSSVGTENMPTAPTLSGFDFAGWNTAQNGSGTAFTATTAVTGSIRVYAQWTQVTPTKYTVTFDGNSGTPAEQTREVNANSSVGSENMPTSPTLSGFNFAGWNTAQNGSGTAFTATTVVTGSIRVYAQWTTKQPITITLDATTNEGTLTGPTSKVVFVGEPYGELPGDSGVWSVNKPNEEFMTFVFAGWYPESTGGFGKIEQDTVVTKQNDHTLYACWFTINNPSFWVTFDANKGHYDDNTTVKWHHLLANTAVGAVNMPKNPERDDGYDFTNWNTAVDGSGTTFDEGTIVSKDIRIYAQWYPRPVYYYVTFDSNGGTPIEDPTRPVENGFSLDNRMPADPTRENYTFDGWYAAGSSTKFTGSTVVTANITVIAKWISNAPTECTVTFDFNYGISPIQTFVKVEKDTCVGDNIPLPTHEGYDLLGWNTQRDGLGTAFTSTTVVTEDITVYAQWERRTVYYDVTFNGNGGTPNEQKRTVAENTTIGNGMPDNPALEDYTFAGWNTKEDATGTAFTGDTQVTGNITVYAKWTKIGDSDRPTVDKVIEGDKVITGEGIDGALIIVKFPGNNEEYTTVVEDGVWTLDVPEGIELEVGDVITVVQKDGEKLRSEPLLVTVAAGKSSEPEVNKITEGDTKVTGKGEPGATIIVTFPSDDEKHEAKVNDDGDWSLDIPEGVELKAGDEITVVQIDGNKDPSDPITVIVEAKSKSGKPEVNDVTEGDTKITGKGEPEATIVVKFPGDDKEYKTKVEDDGNWSLDVPAGKELERGTKIEIIQVEIGKAPSDPLEKTILGKLVKISFDATTNGGKLATGEGDSKTLRVGDHYVLPSVESRGSRYTFRGWFTAQNGGTVVTSATIVTNPENHTLYAQWTDSGGGGGGTTKPKPDNGTEIEDPDQPIGFTEEHIPYIQGYPDNSVKPNNSITRAEVAMIFFRLLSDPGKNASRPSNFKDVANGAWYAQAINYLASIDILFGYPNGTFKPEQHITRAEFAAIASRFDALQPVSGNAFPDIEGHWAMNVINSAAAKGWVEGYPDGSFNPQKKITRAEVVRVVNKMLDRKVKVEDIPNGIRQFTDFEDHWAFADIVEASNDHDYVRKDDGYETWMLK